MESLESEARRWHMAVEQGRFGIWDLDPLLDLVHYSPRWKEHMGFANLEAPDSTSFWRCRVHPDDLAPMLKAMRSHLDGFRAGYEAKFRVRSNGSGYRLMLSRGLAVERDAAGNALRMVGTMVDLTDRPASPLREWLTPGETESGSGSGRLPFHEILAGRAPQTSDGLLGKMSELLEISLRQVTLRA